MQGGPETQRSGPDRRELPRRRAQTLLFTVAFVALAAATFGGVLTARQRALDSADRRVEQAARSAATALETRVHEAVLQLGGAGAIQADDGALDTGVFASFAASLLAVGELQSITLVGVEGGASLRFPVIAAQPVDAAVEIGTDIAADPVRRAALRTAVATASPAVSGLTELDGQGTHGIVIYRPLTGPGDAVGAIVGTRITVASLTETLDGAVSTEMDVALLDDAELLTGPAFERRDPVTSTEVDVPGQSWSIEVRSDGSPDLTAAWLVGAGGGAALLTLGALLLVTERHQRRLGRTNALLRQGEQRTLAVQEVTGRLARALTGREIVRALTDHLPAAVGARTALIALVDERNRLELVRPTEPDDGQDDPKVAVAETSTVHTVLDHREPAWLSSPLAWREDGAVAALAGDGQALAVLPLVAEGVTGVLAVAYPKVHIFSDDEQALLLTVALLASRALARGQRYDAEHRTALEFQRAALPDDLPTIDGLTIAARYRPAAHQATVGGDWYDVQVLDERRVVLVVGDVVGHGMVAAAAMGRLRTAFQAIARLSTDPGAMVRAMSQQIDSIPNSFCTTIVCAVIDVTTGVMSWSRAGHPPPLRVGGDAVRLLDEPGMPPLGVVPDAVPPVHATTLLPGDRVVLYTDGVIERREESIDDGFRRLGLVVEDLADLDPEEFSDALVEALVPVDEQQDDLALLVFRYEGAGIDRAAS